MNSGPEQDILTGNEPRIDPNLLLQFQMKCTDTVRFNEINSNYKNGSTQKAGVGTKMQGYTQKCMALPKISQFDTKMPSQHAPVAIAIIKYLSLASLNLCSHFV